jgi:lysyl-tRNA synthetase class 1
VDPVATEPRELTASEGAAVAGLRDLLRKGIDGLSEKDVQNEIYEIARNAGIDPKDFFRTLYLVLIDEERGPRLGGFLKTLGAERVLAILERY